MPEETTVSVQDPAGTADNGATDGSSNAENTSVQPQESGNVVDESGSTLPPELEETKKQLLRDYHAKTQKLAEDKLRFEQSLSKFEDDSKTLQTLMAQPWFVKAMEAERANRSGSTPESVQMSDEEFEAIKSDKEAFKKSVMGMVERIVNGKVSPAIGNAQSQLQELRAEKEFDSVANKYKDFKELNDNGVLENYLKAGFDYETAYQKYKWDNGIADIDALAEKKAQEILKRSRDGAIGKPGTPQINGKLVVKAKNFDEAFDRVWEALQKGNKDVVVERG